MGALHMAIFEQTAIDLLHTVQNPQDGDIFHFLGEENYTFTYRRNYTGLMAKINPTYRHVAREKQGYFDILGNMNSRNLTHNQLFNLLFVNTTYEDCEQVWYGRMPEAIGERRHVLLSLAMLMFEQEINFGNEIFQRKSHFSPIVNNPYYLRPRDLIMGYVRYMFEQGNTKCLIPFQNYQGLLMPPINNPYIKENYFNVLKNTPYAIALMARPNILNAYIAHVTHAPLNPNI